MAYSFGLSILLIDDFNCVLSSKEKRQDRHFHIDKDVREFLMFLHQYGLVDLGYLGPHFTWHNNGQHCTRVWERLDKILSSNI